MRLRSVIPRSRERADEESPGRTSFAVILTLRARRDEHCSSVHSRTRAALCHPERSDRRERSRRISRSAAVRSVILSGATEGSAVEGS